MVEIQQDRLPARRSVFVHDRGVHEKSALCRQNAVSAVHVAKAMQAWLHANHGPAEGSASTFTAEYALGSSVRDQNVRVFWDGGVQLLAFCFAAHSESAIDRRNRTPPQLDPLDRNRLIE